MSGPLLPISMLLGTNCCVPHPNTREPTYCWRTGLVLSGLSLSPWPSTFGLYDLWPATFDLRGYLPPLPLLLGCPWGTDPTALSHPQGQREKQIKVEESDVPRNLRIKKEILCVACSSQYLLVHPIPTAHAHPLQPPPFCAGHWSALCT